MTTKLTEAALEVLNSASPADKVRLSRAHAEAWRSGALSVPTTEDLDGIDIPVRPARPAQPEVLAPNKMPKRSKGGLKGRISLLHALAHIELNAIDLAWDLILRAVGHGLPKTFFDDWVQVADDEAKHFQVLDTRLGELDSHYGALPAHDGLWEAAEDTRHDLLARLAVVPMVLEARGLDATPPTVERLIANGDEPSAEILRLIAHEEIDHVRAGRVWFEHLCAQEGVEPVETWHAMLKKHFRGKLKPPFNDEAREAAGFATSKYFV